MMPLLKEAGVVDAGGKGLFYVFQGMRNFIVQNMNPVKGYKAAKRKVKIGKIETVYGYDLQFLIEGDKLPINDIRATINTLGESVLVVGDENLIRVHVHTKVSNQVMDYCSAFGTLKDIINDNMDNQVEDFKQQHAHSPEIA
jgi:dihydroxyacetone kinase-like predicted kinase